MERMIKIGGKECKMKTSAALPRIYRRLLSCDVFEDVDKMLQVYLAAAKTNKKRKKEPEDPQARKTKEMAALDALENLAFIMNKHGDPSQPDTVEEWLAQFDDEAAVADPRVVAEIVGLWIHETTTTSKDEKKTEKQTGR